MKNNEALYDYENPIQIARGIYWVGYYDTERNLRCNPYLIIDGDEAVLIDGGSRTDFSTVMLKILKTGITPAQLQTLIYQHYDPDLCSSIPNFEEIINSQTLTLLSHKENNVFIRYYSVSSKMLCIESMNREYVFSSGRKLRFFRTPYAHSAGSFVTYDEMTQTLFSSDLFGSYSRPQGLYAEFTDDCWKCTTFNACPQGKSECPISGIYRFHQRIMTSERALHHAMEVISPLALTQIAPQHGSIIRTAFDCQKMIEKLRTLEGVGIDGIPTA